MAGSSHEPLLSSIHSCNARLLNKILSKVKLFPRCFVQTWLKIICHNLINGAVHLNNCIYCIRCIYTQFQKLSWSKYGLFFYRIAWFEKKHFNPRVYPFRKYHILEITNIIPYNLGYIYDTECHPANDHLWLWQGMLGPVWCWWLEGCRTVNSSP